MSLPRAFCPGQGRAGPSATQGSRVSKRHGFTRGAAQGVAPHAQGSESLSWGMTGVTGCWDWRTGHELTLRCVEYEVLLGHPGGPVREGAEFLSLQMRGKTGPAVRKPDVFKCFENRAQQSPSDGEGSGSHGPGGIPSRSRSLPQLELQFSLTCSFISPREFLLSVH